MFRFQNIQYLWLLIIPLILLLLFIISYYLRKKKIKKIGDIALVEQLMPDYSKARRILKFVLIFLALTFMILALARPQFGSKLQEVKIRGIEIMIALDVSNSMLAQDIKPNRLENSRKFIERIISKLKNDKIGLIVFAGEAYIQMPITDDAKSAHLFLSTIQTGMVPIQGTAIASALELASKSFTKEETSKIIILVTDGENHEDNPLEIAKVLKEKNINVFTVGMGSTTGTPIPSGKGGYLKDRNGNVVTSALDEETLIQIAKITNGIYVKAGNSANAMDKVVEEIDKLQKGEILKQSYAEYDEQFQNLALLAIICLFIDILIPERKNKYLKKINIFK